MVSISLLLGCYAHSLTLLGKAVSSFRIVINAYLF